jgi:hypothetical protein
VFGHDGGGPDLLEAQFGVAMKISAPGDQLVEELVGFGLERLGQGHGVLLGRVFSAGAVGGGQGFKKN